MKEFIGGVKKRLKQEAREYRSATITGIKLGRWKILAVTAEVYASTGLQITDSCPNTFILTHANGNVGYLPTKEEFVKGGYAAGLGQLGYNKRPYTRDCESIVLAGMKHVLDTF